MPRELLLSARSEIRAWSGHWAEGFTAAGESLVKHDRRMADGTCATCALLDVLHAYLYPLAAETGDSPETETEVVEVAMVSGQVHRVEVPVGWPR